MTNWKPGMKAVCVNDRWRKHPDCTELGPSKGDVEVVRCTEVQKGHLYLLFKARTEAYLSGHFRPLLGDEQEALDAIEEEVKETELIPMEA